MVIEWGVACGKKTKVVFEGAPEAKRTMGGGFIARPYPLSFHRSNGFLHVLKKKDDDESIMMAMVMVKKGD